MHKRKSELKRKESTQASTLRRIGEFIQKRDFPAALAKANQVINSTTGVEKARALALVGDSEFKRGRFTEAAQIHLQAATISVNDVTHWLRPYIGQVRALLKVPQVNDALIMARHAMALAEAKMADFNEKVRLTDQSVLANGSVQVPSVPPRVSVVATRMGYLFLQEGEPEAAEEFFQKAIQSAKGGANRARQGMAQIALARGELGDAFNIALDAIRMGKSKAKTISAWSTMIAARRQIGGWKISDQLINKLDAAPAGLRARTTLHIIRELRKNDMRQWKDVATRWIAKEGHAFPRYEKEIRKLILSSEKLVPNDIDGKREAAEQLLSMRVLGPKDWLMGSKEFVRTSLLVNKPVDLAHLLATAESKYGKHFVPRAAHSLALSCMMAKRHDLARPLLQANIQKCNPGSRLWGKSVWALARMENFLGDHLAAAHGYRMFSESSRIQKRYRLQAQLLWVKTLVQSGQTDAIMDAKSRMTPMLSDVQDPEILMNFARQLQTGPDELKAWGRELFMQGESMALAQFNAATHPAVAMAILFKLTRRQVIDFGRSKEAVSLWESFDSQKQDWLWSSSSLFGEYLGLIFEAYVRSGNTDRAEEFANGFLNDPAMPVNSIPLIGMPYASWLIRHRRFNDGIDLCARLVKVAPSHSQCAMAWYWLALEARKVGDIDKAQKYAEQIRATQRVNAGLHKEWCLDAKARLLLADLTPEYVDYQAADYDSRFVTDQLASLNYDMESIQ